MFKKLLQVGMRALHASACRSSAAKGGRARRVHAVCRFQKSFTSLACELSGNKLLKAQWPTWSKHCHQLRSTVIWARMGREQPVGALLSVRSQVLPAHIPLRHFLNCVSAAKPQRVHWLTSDADTPVDQGADFLLAPAVTSSHRSCSNAIQVAFYLAETRQPCRRGGQCITGSGLGEAQRGRGSMIRVREAR